MDDDVTFGHLTTELQIGTSQVPSRPAYVTLTSSARHLLAARIALICSVTFAEAYQEIDNACATLASDDSI